jgi:hypothetical protein
MTRTAHPTAADAVHDAHEFVTRSTAGELAGYLLDTIGPRNTTVGLGLADARQIKAWRDRGTSPREGAVTDRLTLLAQVTRAITLAYSPDTAAAFLRSANPDLEDRSPLLVIADNESPRAQTDVMRAVRAFLES